jgi:hypothetical protein
VKFYTFYIQNSLDVKALQLGLEAGWIPDPILMPTGRPNIIDGMGAIYHLVKSEVEGGVDVQQYIQKSRVAAPESPKPGEFDGVIATISLLHGNVPEGFSPEVAAEKGWSVYKIYEKTVIWILRPVKEAS